MKIQLRQLDIEAAIKLYITAQGINLQGKTVTMDFTAGRKQTGLIADVDIQGTVVHAPVAVVEAEPEYTAAEVAEVEAELPVLDAEPSEASEEEEVTVRSTSSLFG
jgi:hypothetical protein